MTASPRCYKSSVQLPAWGTAEAPPKEFRLFPYGKTTATFEGGSREEVYLTVENCKAIVAEWARREIRGMFDFNHDYGLSFGWYGIEARADGLWVVEIDWTPDTVELFKLKKIRYCSPAFSTIKDKSGLHQIVSLTNIALTNLPATDQQRPLIALSQRARRFYKMTADQARALAEKYISLVKGDSSLIDALALAIIADESGEPGEPADMPADPMAEMASPEVAEVAAAAFAACGTKNAKEAVGALKTFSSVVAERNEAVKELRVLKHSAAVDAAIKERKISPAKREEALAANPEEFRGFLKFAQPLVETEALSAKTRSTAQGAAPTVADLEKDEKLVAYCTRNNLDVKSYAQSFVKFGVPFTE